MPRFSSLIALLALPCLALPSGVRAGPVDVHQYGELRWRGIGPYRGGRTKAAVGVPGHPGLYYIGATNGGVWRSNDFGRTWDPIFDAQPTGSIGAIAVAPSDPRVVYVGSGEGLHRPDLSTGDGLYRSSDSGNTWTHLGLRDAQQIPQIAVDPRDPNRLFVAVLGHPYGPNEQRGLFRSVDGGKTFEKVLYKDPDTGAIDVAFDPKNPQTVYAALWESREAPWENGSFHGPGSGLFKSDDGGTTWRSIGAGLPAAQEGLGRIGIAIAPSQPGRVFATVSARKDGGLYRSDDGGEHFVRATADARATDRADDFAEVRVHPQNPDIVFTASVVVWKSTDAGKTFTALRGAPGGDDYHRIWIDPQNAQILLVGSDQGAIVTVNGGQTWSSWYNQTTAQMYHVTADNAFPYRLCGGQQESGSACVASRSSDGAITFRDWRPASLEEYGYAAPDPLDPDIVYGGRLTRYDRRTGQSQTITPVPVRDAADRMLRTQPVVFSPLDPHLLFFASNRLWSTRDGGRSWSQLSPDLTRKTWALPANIGKYREQDAAKVTQRGVIYSIAPSPVEAGTLWVGTDDGLLHVTRDGGKAWRDVTPAAVPAWAKVAGLDASHFDAGTAYAALNTLRLDDLRPHILRTRDGGAHWTEIVQGLPSGTVVNAVREDPRQRGLLFAGTEQQVFVSFDDGDHWQTLRQNMPATSIRDLIIKGDDVAVATHGRGFWILDDIAPLRELAAAGRDAQQGPARLFRPQTALRVRWNTYPDTPLPPDEPAGLNPPDGAIVDYFLASPAAGPVTLEFLDANGQVLRRFSSEDKAEPPRDEQNIPRYWIRPAPVVATSAGHHRFVWDLHRPSPASLETSYPISAVYQNTWREPRGPWVPPGRYQVRLTVGGAAQTQPLEVRMDPRIRTPAAALERQAALSVRLADALDQVTGALLSLRKLRAQAAPQLAARLAALDDGGQPSPRRGRAGATAEAPTLERTDGELAGLLQTVQETDAEPVPQVARAAEKALGQAASLLTQWKELASGSTTRP